MSPEINELNVIIMRRIDEAPDDNQRALARAAGVSLGKLNFALRALIEKGWVKAGNFTRNSNKLGYAYLLTPSGAEAKVRLTKAFLERKMSEYEALRVEIEHLRKTIEEPSE